MSIISKLKLSNTDEQLSKPIIYIEKEKDPYHVERRFQQRAINETMTIICLKYGIKKWIHGALTYTITDRALLHTTYYKYIDSLRGLRVVCLETTPYNDEAFYVLTVYWYSVFRKKKLNSYAHTRVRTAACHDRVSRSRKPRSLVRS